MPDWGSHKAGGDFRAQAPVSTSKRGDRPERDDGAAPEFAPAFLTRDDD